MEIDFLGLNAPKYSTTSFTDSHTLNDGFYAAAGGVETSLSLSTTCCFDSQTNILSISEEKNSSHYNHGINTTTTPEQTNSLLAPVPVGPLFHYDLNDWPTSIIASEFPSEAMLGSPNVFPDTLHKQADKVLYGSYGESRISTNGYTPTVAMARSATLARFLEKRLHRLNKGRTSHDISGNRKIN